MSRQRPSRQFGPFEQRLIDSPGTKRGAILDQKIPVNSVPVVFEDREPDGIIEHGLSSEQCLENGNIGGEMDLSGFQVPIARLIDA
jgi:hypothetical protein